MNVFRRPINSRNASPVSLRRTSSAIFAGMRRLWRGDCSTITAISSSQAGSFNNPKAKRYSFVSRTSRKFLLPQLFSYFPHFLNCFFLAHASKWRACLGNNLPYFSQMLFSLFDVRFCHDVTSMFKFTTFQKRCQGYLAGNENDSDFAVRPDETELKCYSDFINGTTKKRMGQKHPID